MVKNEQDIIEPFLRHNRQFFDAMIILDNQSADRTRGIVEACSRELNGIIFTDMPRTDYAQAEIMTATLHHVQAAFFADFVCFLDADEFIAAPDRSTFEELLSVVPIGQYSLHPWRTFLHSPHLTESDNADPLQRMTFRRRREKPIYRKAFLHLGGGLNPNLVMEQGNHSVSTLQGDRPKGVKLDAVPLMHFPIRSAAQLASRGAIGWMANLARGTEAKATNQARQWKRILELARKNGTRLSSEVLADEGMVYAQKTAPSSFWKNAVPATHDITSERKYSDGTPGDPFVLVTEAWAATVHAEKSFALPQLKIVEEGSKIENAFDNNWHWENLFLDLAPFRYLLDKYQPGSALDVGCGNGGYLRLLQVHGVEDIFGVDGISQSATVLPRSAYSTVDLQQPQDLGRTFDLVLCLEVVEHLSPDATRIVLDSIERHARDLIVFSMAEPGQPGNGHINCRTMDEVLDIWASRGWVPDLIDTLGIRALASMSWFRRNLLVLKRKAAVPDASVADAALRRIGALHYRWYSQRPGVRSTAFQEPYPELSRAYGLVRPMTAPLAPIPPCA
jgi:SAM-dependent methyltransferase